jgi:hypothetical protein
MSISKNGRRGSNLIPIKKFEHSKNKSKDGRLIMCGQSLMMLGPKQRE